jgi:predicted nucleic acid-binding protein
VRCGTIVVPLDESLALAAADVSLEHGLAMADAIIYPTAARHRAEIITVDADLGGLPGVTRIR